MTESRIEAFLSHFPTKKKTPNGYEAQCPAHDDNRASLSIGLPEDGKILLDCKAGCKTQAVVKAIGFEMKDLSPSKEPIKKNSLGKIVATYSYKDEAGILLYQCIRYNPKDFRQRRPDGANKWIWNLKGCRLVPYRLPELLSAAMETPVFVVEGEKDVDNAFNLGLIATCNPMGAGKWHKEFNQFFKDRQVFIIPDADEPGRKHAQLVKAELSKTAKSVFVLELPGSEKDLSSWLMAGGTIPVLMKLTENLKQSTETPSLKILGHTYDGDLLIWYRGKLLSKGLSEVSRDWVSLITGCEPNLSREIRDNWIAQAHKAGVFDASKKLGAGVWPTKEGWIIVSGDKALVVRSGKVEVTGSPCVDGIVIEHDNDPWVDLAQVNEFLNKASLTNCFSELKDIVSQWVWASPGMADVATATLMFSPFQRAMTWRPWVSVVGATSSGKSLFVDQVIKKLFGQLHASCDKSTAHGAAQTIGGKGLIAVFDEFDKSKHVPDVLELFKLTGRGGIKQSGTNKEHAYKYEIKHLPWFLAASSPGAARHDAALANRFIHLEMNSGLDRTPPVPMNPDTVKKLTSKIVATMITSWDSIMLNSKAFEAEGPGVGPDPRMLDNYSNIIGLLRTATGKAWKIPQWENCIVRTDGDIALNTILDSVPYSEGASIRMLLSDITTMRKCEKYGVARTNHKGIDYLAIRTDAATRHLLKDTPLKDIAIGDHLKRISGAKASECAKLEGVNQRCILIPMSYINAEPAPIAEVTAPLPECYQNVTTENGSTGLYKDTGNKVTNNMSGEIEEFDDQGSFSANSETFPHSQAETRYFVTEPSKALPSAALPGNKSVTNDCYRAVTEPFTAEIEPDEEVFG